MDAPDTAARGREAAPSWFQNRPLNRPLVAVVQALMAGIAATAWGLQLPAAWLAAALALLWAAMGILWRLRRPVRFLALAFFGLLGVAWQQQAAAPLFPPHHIANLPQEQELILRGHIYRAGKTGSQRVQLFLTAASWLSPQGWQAATGRLLVRAPDLEPPPAGTEVVVKGRLRTPRSPQNPGAYDRARHLAADRVFRELRLRDRQDLIFLAGSGAPPLAEQLRGGIRRLLRNLDPPLRAVYLAMLLGDQGEITPEMRANLARTGTSHLLVINGLHLGMVAAVIYFLSFWLLRRWAWLLLRLNASKVATFLAALAVVGYAWVAGGSPSTQRAEVMVLAYLLLVLLGRPREVWSALALAALVILTLSPLRLFAISFQLSFAAVAALVYLVPRLVRSGAALPEDRFPKVSAYLLRHGKEWLIASAVATLATAPLVAAYFQVVSLLGILVNLAAIPLVLGLALPLGEAAVLAQALTLTPLAQGLIYLGKFPLWLGLQAVEGGARVPGSAIIAPIPTWLQISLYYLLLLLLAAPRRDRFTYGGAALAGLALAATAALPLMRPSPALEITCLDAGSGLRAVVVAPDQRRLVLSAPGPSWPGKEGQGWGPLPGYCHWRQFRHLEAVVGLALSHDNAAEFLTLAQQFTVGGFWYGRRGRQGPAYWDLWNFLGDRGRLPRSLDRDPCAVSLGEVGLAWVQLGRDRGEALRLSYAGRNTLILLPGTSLGRPEVKEYANSPLHLLVLPATAVRQDGVAELIRQPGAARLVIYGAAGGLPAEGLKTAAPCLFTAEGAVSVYLAPGGVTVRQWRP